ncbi:MAG: BlaI/MecI/CopY family transcriptional regulator [Planctomycetota bacterium]|jgi:BlaI family penicillinase repressor
MEGKVKKQPKISESEWLIMRVLWRRSPRTANEVVDELTPQTPWKPKTIKTLLSRLVKKGAVGFSKKGRAYDYHPLLTEAESVRAESRSFLERVYGGALAPMLAHFLEDDRLSPEEIDRLRRILDGRR